ncbi:MAG: tRNA pseudouridine(55) synthase TruB [Patescibacteria group bacterium]
MILNIYKEKCWTSFDVVAKIRGMLGKKRKVGHAGTLDPLAEGVLIVLTDEDTKKQNEFMTLKKEYEAKIAFGITTPTYDLEVLPDVSNKQLSLEEILGSLKDLLPKYIGGIDQKVPSYSAVKVDGKRLYKQARSGDVDEDKLPVKRVTIYNIKLLNNSVEKIETKGGIKEFPIVTIKIECSSGTYVRSLAHDLGEDLGIGAVLVNLVRTKVGDFKVFDSRKITELKI